MPVLVLTLLTLLFGSAPAAAQSPAAPAEESLVPLDRGTHVREYAGWLLFSRWDGSAFRLSTWHAGTVRDLAVSSQAKAFDADLGPDSAGRPSAVFSQCEGSCDLAVIGLAPGASPRPVRNANTSQQDETSPSVWRGRIAFARRYDAQTVAAYTKRLDAPRARPSSRLAGLPAERCGAVDAPDCRPIDDAEVVGLELWGRWVAQSWTYQPTGFPGFRQNEIRLTDIARTDTRQVAAMVTGLGGQSYLGPSAVDGHVAFAKTCKGDPGGCFTANSGPLRYRITTARYEHDGVNQPWSAWAWDGSAGYRVPSDYACGSDAGVRTEACAIVRRPDGPWVAIAAGSVR